MQGILIASAATGSPILSSRLDFHAQTLAQQALEALNTFPDPVLWLPLLHRPSAPTSTRGPPAKTGTGDYDENSSSESDSDITSAQEIWNQPNAGPSTRSSSQPTGGAAACVVRRSGLIFLVPVAADIEPLLSFAFVEALIDLLTDYFGPISESVIKDSFDVVLQILEEAIAMPHPVLTDASAMKELIPPPTFFTRMLSAASSALAPGSSNASAHNAPAILEARQTLSSPIPWRRNGIRHQNQECFFDIAEELNAIVDKHGQLVTADVWGQIEAKCRLSGMPDLSMSLTSPDLLQDCCFHPCVRLTKWSQSKALSFVPPDGKFTLMEYRLAKPTSSTVLPLTVKPTITTGSSGGSFQLVISSTQPLDRPLDKVRIELLLGTHASDVQASLSGGRPAFAHHGKASTSSLQSKTAESQNAVGRWEYLPDRGAVVWQSNRLSSGETAVVLQGTWVSAIKPCPRPAPAVSAGFEAPLTNVSGIQVSALKIASSNSESGAPFKGVRAMMRSRCIDFRW